MNAIRGRRTYGLALLAISWGIAGYLLDELTYQQATEFIFGGGIAMALRAGIGNDGRQRERD